MNDSKEGVATEAELAARAKAMEEAELASSTLRSEIKIRLYHGGNMQVDGPLEDRVLFHGMLYMANEIGQNYAKSLDEANRLAMLDRNPKKGSMGWWRRQVTSYQERVALKKKRADIEAKEEANRVAAAARHVAPKVMTLTRKDGSELMVSGTGGQLPQNISEQGGMPSEKQA